MAATPLLATVVLNHFGLTAAYGLLSGLMLICLAASFLAIDYPNRDPVLQTAGASACPVETKSELLQPGLVRDSRFWRLALAAGLYNAVIVMFSTELVPYATGLGIDPTRAAVLLTAYLVGTLIGTPFVGWMADKVGGARMIGSLCLSLALWQACLLIQPAYPLIALLALLAGLQGSAMISCLGLALSEQLGQAGFARAWGASTLVGLPFAVLSVPVASGIFVQTGSYRLVFMLAAAMLAVGAVLALSIGRRSQDVSPVVN
jgi:MFS family permease